MRLVSCVGQDNLLVTFDGDGRARLTERFSELTKAAKEFGAELVVLDTAADLFGGNENDRSQVRQFIGYALGNLAKAIGCAVLLNAHPSRSGMSATGDMDGGSTGWSNTARSRWSLTRPQVDGEEAAPDTDERLLTRRKANYAARGTDIKLRWSNGILAPDKPASSGFARLSDAIHAEQVFLALLDRLVVAGVHLSHSRNAGNFAPKIMVKRPDRDGLSARDLEGAMHRLFEQNRIAVREYDRQHHKAIVRADGPGDLDEGDIECALGA